MPEETFTHLHPSSSPNILYQLPPSTTIHGILLVHFTCLTVLFHNFCPGFWCVMCCKLTDTTCSWPCFDADGVAVTASFPRRLRTLWCWVYDHCLLPQRSHLWTETASTSATSASVMTIPQTSVSYSPRDWKMHIGFWTVYYLYLYFVRAAVALDFIHMTASSSALWSRFSPLLDCVVCNNNKWWLWKWMLVASCRGGATGWSPCCRW